MNSLGLEFSLREDSGNLPVDFVVFKNLVNKIKSKNIPNKSSQETTDLPAEAEVAEYTDIKVMINTGGEEEKAVEADIYKIDFSESKRPEDIDEETCQEIEDYIQNLKNLKIQEKEKEFEEKHSKN